LITVYYRDLATDLSRFQPAYMQYDAGFQAQYLSVIPLNEFISFNGTRSMSDIANYRKSQGFGGLMTFTMDEEYISGQTGDAAYPLSTALYNATFGTPGP